MANEMELLRGATRQPEDAASSNESIATQAPVEATVPDVDLSLREIERRHIEHVVADSETLVEAAARLGIDTATLWRKRKRYGMK